MSLLWRSISQLAFEIETSRTREKLCLDLLYLSGELQTQRTKFERVMVRAASDI